MIAAVFRHVLVQFDFIEVRICPVMETTKVFMNSSASSNQDTCSFLCAFPFLLSAINRNGKKQG